jgi:TatD DNase family protein
VADRLAGADLPAPRGGGRALSRRRAPERLPGLVDSHAHLQHARFEGDRDAVIARAVEAGLERILVPGWDVASSEAALELAARHPGVVDAAVGIHPHDAASMDEPAWARLEALVADPRARAVGEIGLDHFRNLSPPAAQRDVFERQLALAAERGLPVLVHHRDAHAEVTDALLAWAGRAGQPARGVLHAFSGDADMAARLTGAGFLVSFALPVAFRSAAGPREAATALPAGSFLVETDSPYLGPDREALNEPTTALRVVAELARLRGEAAEDLVAPMRGAYRSLVGA